MKGLISTKAFLQNIRQTEYLPQYANDVVEHMSQGQSFKSFAGKIGVTFETLKNWEEKFEEFAIARSVGEAKSLLFFEGKILDKAEGRVKAIDFEALKFKAKNSHPEDFQDKQNVAVQGGVAFMIETGVPSPLPIPVHSDELPLLSEDSLKGDQSICQQNELVNTRSLDLDLKMKELDENSKKRSLKTEVPSNEGTLSGKLKEVLIEGVPRRDTLSAITPGADSL